MKDEYYFDKLDDEEESYARQLAEEQKAIDMSNAEYEKKWPRHCRICGGWGFTAFSQGHPYGSTTAYETITEQCECVELGNCPRCGLPSLGVGAEGPCEHCGWNNDNGLLDSVY